MFDVSVVGPLCVGFCCRVCWSIRKPSYSERSPSLLDNYGYRLLSECSVEVSVLHCHVAKKFFRKDDAFERTSHTNEENPTYRIFESSNGTIIS